MSLVDVSVIVCTLNRSSLLNKCLNSLENQEVGQFSFETIIVDNGSTDDTKAVVESFQTRIENLSYVREPQKGLGRARNSGLRASRGRLIAYIDDDAQADPGWCAAIYESFQSLHAEGKDKIVGLGGPCEPLFEGERPEWFSPQIGAFYAAWGLGDETTSYPPGLHPIGANCAFRREVLLDNPWNVQLVMLEDVDLFRRLHRNGYTDLYIPQMRIRHFIPANKLNVNWLLRKHYTDAVAEAQVFFMQEGFLHRLWIASTSLLKLPCHFGFSLWGSPERRVLSRCKMMAHRGFIVGLTRRQDLTAHPYLAEKWKPKA